MFGVLDQTRVARSGCRIPGARFADLGSDFCTLRVTPEHEKRTTSINSKTWVSRPPSNSLSDHNARQHPVPLRPAGS